MTIIKIYELRFKDLIRLSVSKKRMKEYWIDNCYAPMVRSSVSNF